MKKIFNLTTIIVAFSLISCRSDFSDEKSSYLLPINLAVSNSKTLNEAVVGVYSGLDGQQLNDVINFSELITDNGFLSNANNGQYAEIYNLTYAPGTQKIGRLWNGLNDVIVKANWVLSYEGTVKYDPKVDSDQADFDLKAARLFSEARVLRAYARILLAGYFCERLGGDNQQLGLVINDKYSPTEIYDTYPRATVPETYAAIEADLIKAINSISATANSVVAVNDSRMNLLSANLLLSRVYLYERKWTKSLEFANAAKILADDNSIVETSSAIPFPTGNNGNVSSIFQFAIDSKNTLGINSLFSYWGYNNSAQYQQFYATQEFVSLIPAADGRKKIYPLNDSPYDTPKPYFAKKFGSSELYNVILMRKAEIDFNIIESTFYSDPNGAKTLLTNWIKANRYAGYTFTNPDILAEILLQRRIEFAFEGHRFMDLKRNDLGWTKGANYKGSHANILINEKEQCLPIPFIEMTTNPKMVQNPGY